MKFAVALFALLAVANAGVIAPAILPAGIPATTLVRTPAFDSAVIKSDRLGGNFAYSSVEGHAYAAVSPVVQNVVSPVGVSYTATPVATPINVIHQQYVPSQILAPQYITPGQVVAPVVPGVAAPSFPFYPIDGLIPSNPAVVEKPAEGEAVNPEPAPIAPAEVLPAPLPSSEEAAQSDAVNVEAV